MSFINNHKEAQISEKKLYTGVCPVEVIAINPTVNELKSIYNKDEVLDPSYTKIDENGVKQTRLDFYLKNEDIDLLTKMSIFLQDKVDVSSNGKTKFINKRIQTMYADSLDSIALNPKLTWFDIKTAREAKVGEELLYEFLVKVTNASTDETSELMLENLDAIINGDVTELKNINDKLGKGVKVLLGIKDGQYQSVYNRYFQRFAQNGTSAMEKRASGEYGGFTSDYQNSMELQEYAMKPMPSKDTIIDNSSEVSSSSMF